MLTIEANQLPSPAAVLFQVQFLLETACVSTAAGLCPASHFLLPGTPAQARVSNSHWTGTRHSQHLTVAAPPKDFVHDKSEWQPFFCSCRHLCMHCLPECNASKQACAEAIVQEHMRPLNTAQDQIMQRGFAPVGSWMLHATAGDVS